MTEAAIVPPGNDAVTGAPSATGSPAADARIWALVPCAGIGSRAATAIPKQYQPIAGQAMVLHTLAALAAVARVFRTMVVVAAGDGFFARSGVAGPGNWGSVACGGATRAETVANGLRALGDLGAADHDWVLVHDAARCLVTPELINRLIDACQYDAVGGLLAYPVADTLKLAKTGRVVATTDRSHYWLAQTPQMFRIGLLSAGLRAAGDRVTDESAAIEALGLSPKLIDGGALNFKVTYAQDFALAHAVLMARGRTVNQDLDYDYP